MIPNEPKRYILHCLLEPALFQWHRAIVEEIAEKTGLEATRTQDLAAHITLKYWFQTDEIEQVESLLKRFAETHRPSPIRIGPAGHFNREVIFYAVELSAEARASFMALIGTLRELPWMPWDRYDAENLHFHMTVAESCGDRFEQAWTIAKARETIVDAKFDNVTLLQESGERDGVDLWTVRRKFELSTLENPAPPASSAD
jgi:2'-5' RNA ligase